MLRHCHASVVPDTLMPLHVLLGHDAWSMQWAIRSFPPSRRFIPVPGLNFTVEFENASVFPDPTVTDASTRTVSFENERETAISPPNEADDPSHDSHCQSAFLSR